MFKKNNTSFFASVQAILFACASFLFYTTISFAQQDPQYSQYMFNQLSINPGYAGAKECLSSAVFLRNQWTGIAGAPKTETFTIHSPLRKKAAAIGFTVIADQIGPKKSIGALGSYAYRIRLGKGKLSMGLRFGIYQYVFDGSLITYKDPSDPNTSKNTTSFLFPTADAGAYYYTASTYAGFSATHLFNGRLADNTNQSGVNVQLDPHLFLTAGHAWVLSDKLIFNPSLMVKYVKNSALTADANFSFLFQKRIWAGVSFRSLYGVVAYAQVYINDKFKVGYAYDIGLNKLGRAAGSTHELMISYDLKAAKTPFFSPRYF